MPVQLLRHIVQACPTSPRRRDTAWLTVRRSHPRSIWYPSRARAALSSGQRQSESGRLSRDQDVVPQDRPAVAHHDEVASTRDVPRSGFSTVLSTSGLPRLSHPIHLIKEGSRPLCTRHKAGMKKFYPAGNERELHRQVIAGLPDLRSKPTTTCQTGRHSKRREKRETGGWGTDHNWS